MKATSTAPVRDSNADVRYERPGSDWDERLRATPIAPHLADHYVSAIPEGYKQDVAPGSAPNDLAHLEGLGPDDVDLALRRVAESNEEWVLTLYLGGRPASLSEILPILQSLGVEVLDERPYVIANTSAIACRIYRFSLRYPERLLPPQLDDADFARRFTDTCAAIWHGRAEADRFNELVPRGKPRPPSGDRAARLCELPAARRIPL